MKSSTKMFSRFSSDNFCVRNVFMENLRAPKDDTHQEIFWCLGMIRFLGTQAVVVYHQERSKFLPEVEHNAFLERKVYIGGAYCIPWLQWQKSLQRIPAS